MKKSGFILIAILILASFLRLWNLGLIPTGITNDESYIIYNAYSLMKTGKDITGTRFPLAIQLDNSISPVSMYIVAPFVGIFGLSAFAGRLPFAIAGILTVFLLYKIVLILFKNNTLALVSAFVLAVSPWHIHMSRIAYECNYALFFMLLTMYFVFQYHKSKQILWSLIPLTLSFYSYHATKLFLVFWYPVTLYFISRIDKSINKKYIVYCIGGFILVLVSFYILMKTQTINRQYIFIWNDLSQLTGLVNWERTINTSPQWIKPIFNNKITANLSVVRENYLEAFSPQYLFIFGEPSGLALIYGVSWRGVMYLIELPFLLIGMYYVFRKHRLIELYIFTCLLLAPLPASFTSDRSYGSRAIMMLPFLSIIAGLGMYMFIKKIFVYYKTWFFPVIVILTVFYGYLICSYVYQYHYRYSLYGAESFFQSNRDLAKYIIERSAFFKKILLVDNGGFIHQYAFYGKLSPDDAHLLYTMPKPKSFKNLYFLDSCIDKEASKSSILNLIDPGTSYIAPDYCNTNIKPTQVIREAGNPSRILRRIFENPLNGDSNL
jgi:4-amino-4-deoxy-L-arabinose transferase-like glycosyltransferase